MVRWGLGICAVVFTVMLLIPVPLRPGAGERGHAEARAADTRPNNLPVSQGLSPVAAPRAGTALMSLPDSGPVEVPAPAMPDLASITALTTPDAPPEVLPDVAAKKTDLIPALAVLKAKPRKEFYEVTAGTADLRAGPSSRERSILQLDHGERVELLSRFADRWFFVRLADGKTEGYLDATLLSPAD